MAHFLPPELVRQVNKFEWPKVENLHLAILSTHPWGGVAHVSFLPHYIIKSLLKFEKYLRKCFGV